MSSIVPWPALGVAAEPAKQLIIAAASDLSAIQIPLADAFHKPGVQLRFTFGSSGMLARQIAAGAPFDVFLSADQQRIQDLVAGSHILADSVVVYAVGRLALWSKDSGVRTLEDLRGAKLRHIAIANPAHAPYGVAAREALESKGLWRPLAGKIVYGESVRQAVEYASSGNAEAALVAYSLVIHQGGIPLPEELYRPIRQSGGVVSRSRMKTEARGFLHFLQSAEGRRLLQSFGFR